MSVARKMLTMSLGFVAGVVLAAVVDREVASTQPVREPVAPNLPPAHEGEIPVLFHTRATPQDICEGVEVTYLNPGSCPAYLRLVRYALSKYPPDVLFGARVNRIVVIGRMQRNGHGIAGLAHFDSQTIYLAAMSVDGRYSESFDRDQSRRRVIHHEIFHFLHRFLMPWYDLKVWLACNPAGFQYGESRKELGCVSKYAATSLIEDQCETFAAVMARDPDLQERLIRDPFFATKVSFLEDLLRKISPQLADHFHRIYAQK